MKSWIPLHSLRTFALLGASTLVLEARPFSLEETTWDNPEFVKWFTGTYAFDGQINPRINSDEQALFQEIAPLMRNNTAAAINAIQTYIDEVAADVEADPHSPALDYTLGSLFLESGNSEAAKAQYEKAIERFPTFQRAYQNLGLALVQERGFEEALPYLTKAVELGASGGTIWGLIGFSYLNTGKATQALAAYEQALLFQPESRDWRLGKLNALLEARETVRALALLREMLEEDPENMNLWLQQANAYLGLGEMMEAAASLEWVARRGGGSTQSLLLLGDLYLNEGLFPLALNAYEAVLEGGEADPERMLSTVSNLSARGAGTEATVFLQAVKATFGEALSDKQNLEALNIEAQLALADGRRDEAASLLEKIIGLDPMNGPALITLGDYYRDQGESERAALQYERAAEVEEVEVKALLALGRLHVRERDYRKALHYLNEAQRIQPQSFVADYIHQLEQVVRTL